ncbi:MAG: ABC transporter ATP-binding protein [Planctomycetota bacterium]|nr:ABC transporter ATP-binding protein [Planctomycetota bacterium]
MSELVRLEGLKRYYGSYLAFEADEVVLEPGVIGLLGPNGAGKSTLLNMLMGLLAPSSGRAWMLGFETAKESRRARSRVGYMPENDSFVAGLSVLQFVSLAGELHGQKPVAARRRAHEVLSLLGLEEARYRLIEEQPTGIRQRAKLAQALINNPDLVILDEPTNGLDPAGRSAMLELISRLHQEQGKSILLSSHLLGDVERVCDSVVILDKGKVLAHGEVGALASSRANSYRIQVSGSREDLATCLEQQGVEVESLPPRIGAGSRDYIVTLPEQADSRLLFEAFATGGVAGQAGLLSGLWPHEENLETVFERIVAAEATAQTAAGPGEAG